MLPPHWPHGRCREVGRKIWGTGPGRQDGTVFDMTFPGLVIGNVSVSSGNHEQYFALAQECTPQSSLGNNVYNISFGASDSIKLEVRQ
jgi:hypothetical protein